MWVNDSTDVGDEAFDVAVRRELDRVLAGVEWRRIPMTHAIFQAPYDLSRGYKQYRVPPGDKYRVEYLEGLWVNNRLTVIYTRNDYGDGLEIDVRTHPLMTSLSDLSPADMQESSVRMGMNLVTFFLNRGRPAPATAWKPPAEAPAVTPPAPGPAARALDLLVHADQWTVPTGWGSPLLTVRVAPTADGAGTALDFDTGGRPFRAWNDQAIVTRSWTVSLTSKHRLVVDVTSRLTGGARVALAFSGTGPVPYVETAPVFVLPGLNRDVTFDLGLQTFRSAATNWQPTGAFPQDLQISAVHLVVYPQQGSGRVEFGNLRLTGKLP